MKLKTYEDWPIKDLEINPYKTWRRYDVKTLRMAYARNGHAEDLDLLPTGLKSSLKNAKNQNILLQFIPLLSFKVMQEDLRKETGSQMFVTQSFRDINAAVRDFKEKFQSDPWLTESNPIYPNYFADKPTWKRNGNLFVNQQEFGIPGREPGRPQQDPVLQKGITRYSPAYGGNFVGNDHIKYWWFDPSYPEDSGKWWYRKEAHSKKGSVPSATPGMSNHGWGIALDFDAKFLNDRKAVDWMANNMLKYGWARESIPSDPYHVTCHACTYLTPFVHEKIVQQARDKQASQINLRNINPSIGNISQKTNTNVTQKLSFVVDDTASDFSISSRKNTMPIQTAGGAFGRQATVVSSKFAILPGLKNLDGLPPKIFKIAKPYNGSSDPGDYLTYDEFFEMMIHPLIGNFSFALAAVFTAIASREGNLGQDKIAIGVANGSEHLGFLQIRCKPENTEDFSAQTGWVGKGMLWSVPYDTKGEPILSSNNKKYAWEAFIKDENLIKEIKTKASSSSAASRKSALSLINANTPAFTGQYDLTDKKNASSYLADWARIPVNQVWMMKSRFTLAPNYLDKQVSNIILPYLPQPLVLKPIDRPWSIKGVGFLFNPWNVDGENTWKQGADVNIAFNVLVNWFKQYGYFFETDRKPTTAQAKTRALKELTDLASYMEQGKKNSFNSWLSGIDD